MAPAHALDAASLTARHTALREQLASNQFKRPLYLESLQAAGRLKGDIYAQIEQPFGVVAPALQGMDHWCDILILHLNVNGCRASATKAGDTLSVSIGRKFDQLLGDAYGFEFLYQVRTSTQWALPGIAPAPPGWKSATCPAATWTTCSRSAVARRRASSGKLALAATTLTPPNASDT
ncbi:hypothetical protein [Immundisolibacter sp.]